MTTIVNKMPYGNAKQFVNAINNDIASLYVYIGRPQPWDDDNSPPAPLNNLQEEYKTWYDMLAMKKVVGSDVSQGFKKISWVSGTTYYEYDDTIDLSDKNFYVVTDDNRVYKCIYNNNNSASTSKPTHNTSNIVTYADNYRWKFMFEIPASAMRKFSIGDYLPILTDEVVADRAIVGAIENFKLVSAGSGYTPSASLPVFVYGDGNENSTARCNITTNGGEIQTITLTDGGSDYEYVPGDNVPVLIRQISTTGAVETAYAVATTGVTNQEIESLELVIPGSGYSDGEAIIVRSSCEALAQTNSLGEIESVDVITGLEGINFRKATAKVVGTSVAEAIIRPVISPFDGHGARPDKELYARYVLLNMNFAYAEGDGDFSIENDFRRIGLIENPYIINTTTVATARTLDAKRRLVVDTVVGQFNDDDILYGQTSGAKAFLVDFKDNEIRYTIDPTLSNNIDFTIEQVRSSSGASANIVEIIEPEVELYSGDILFINNRIPISRSINQIETITLVLEY